MVYVMHLDDTCENMAQKPPCSATRAFRRHPAVRTVKRDDPVAILVRLGHNRVRLPGHLRL